MSKELKLAIKQDKNTYKSKNILIDCYKHLTCNQIKLYQKVIITARKYRYYRNQKGLLNKVLRIYYERKHNLLAQKTHINIQAQFGKNLKIYHENIIINQYAKIGDNVTLHGNNCIGNNGTDIKKCPVIGNNVDIGYGATIIGNITIADNIIIGANSLVNKSFTEQGITIAGNPAKKIK